MSATSAAPPTSSAPSRVARTGLVASLLATVLMLLAPFDLTWPQQVVAAVGVGVVILWFTEALPLAVSGLLAVGALVLLGAGPADEVISPMGSTTLLTFIGAFMIAQAVMLHGAGRRLALRILSIPWVSQRQWRLVAAVGLVTALLSTVLSNTATVAMLLPTCLGMIALLGDLLDEVGGTRRDVVQMGAGLLLALTYGSSIGGMLTPVGSPPNLLGIELVEDATGEKIGFFDWMLMTAPIGVALFLAMLVLIPLLNPYRKVDTSRLHEVLRAEAAELGRLTSAERRSVLVLALTALAWAAPSVARVTAGEDAAVTVWLMERFDEGVVAVVGAALLFILPAGGSTSQRVLTWAQGKQIDWGTIMLFASGIVLGAALQSTGLAEVLGEAVGSWVGDSASWVILVVAVVMALSFSELASNTAATLAIVPIALPIALAGGGDPMAVGIAATLAATLGFMLPVSTTQNAIVYGSGKLPMRNMVRTGIAFDLCSLLLIAVLVPMTVSMIFS